jgi:hypothetical protein
MDEDKSCIYFPMWLFVVGLIVLNLVSCCHSIDFSYEESFIHSCPEDGHGDCPICCDPYKNENQEIIVLDR